MKAFFSIILIAFFSLSNFSQTLDSIQKLEEVVITGQYSKQSVKKSVYEVKVITAKDIQQNAANNLADLLNQNLNIQILPNSQTGKSEVSLFGLDGQYFKVLLDGIPMVSDEGFGNNIDLTQIKLDDIKQIEIVEGAMGVEYGANAITGIINLITDKSKKSNTNIQISIQEETVGNEYELWNKGRHIQSFNLNQGLTEHWLFNLNLNRNDFRGFLGERMGKNYNQLSPALRGYEWLPKEQTDLNATINFNKGKYNFFYKLGYLREMMHDYNKVINTSTSTLDYTTDSLLLEKTGNDRDFLTQRFIQNLNSNGVIGKVKFDFSAAYQHQFKDVRKYAYDLYTHESTFEDYKPYLNRRTLYLKNTYSNFINIPKVNIQTGFEYNYESGYTDATSQEYSQESVSLTMSNWDVFLSSEYRHDEKLTLRAGGRYSFQSFFDDQKLISLSASYILNENINFKIVYGGSSFRTPRYQELYEYFVNESHSILGNPNLKVELGSSLLGHFNFNLFQDNNKKVELKLTLGKIVLSDKIELMIKNINPIEYTYFNIDKVKSLIGNIDLKYQFKNLQVGLGCSTVGEKDSNYGSELYKNYLFSFKINSNVVYSMPKNNINLLLSYKYNGPEDQWMVDENDSDTYTYYKIRTNGYQWADLSIKKGFFKNNFETTFGVRNLFNVSDLERKGIGQGGQTHSNDTSGIALGYGRSYFVKLTYNFKSKE